MSSLTDSRVRHGAKACVDAPKNRADRRKKTNRYYFRLTDDQAKKLDRLLKKLGYSTVQSFCEALIRQEVSRNGV